MASSSSSNHSFLLLLLFPLLLVLLLSTTVVAADSTATAEKYQKWCQVASDSPSCVKVIESIPGIQEVDYNNAGKVADLCLHFAANKTKEAKGAADTLLAAEKGKPASGCLKACATNIKSMAEVLVNLPAGQDDMNAYQTYKEVRAKFKNEKPPACEKDCWNKTSSSSSSAADIVDKFHDIWNVAKVGNMQINYIFPWPDSDDDDNIL
ncbi:hypothetical protein BDA96_05G009600 [Sorghum bicolor]|jgi:pectinesterase inhibitor-like protein|uniref:Pectinesterase inhibitor domain-containing protein n=2 Tax=Sorghum bicolor TaxID=4558 RepID=A0A921QXF5_SORBI|nr:hypothetical protein SORBI_3005G009700 [Sorghum bicolor]EES07873.1 hypothetical protein SORBI_3005G010000 [Sorghum bicolor]KAG0528307.1 hypothetical protein BDA96_05G000200 [Sorghum bicolor]KAG0528409.1 hypothetical protein BDA96_05G008900 [Sorghum bicolor]KAG0528411.1 hypothetical protein BDA96_05G009100 [Sorghum bicolor]